MRVWALTIAALLTVAVAAASAAVVHPSVSPSVLRGDGPWPVTYQVELDSGPVDEQVPFAVSDAYGVPPEPVLDGPGTLTPTGTSVGIADRFCAAGTEAFAETSGQGTWLVSLPANTVNTISLTTLVNRRFGLGEQSFGDLTLSVGGQSLALAGPAIVARRDAGISLSVGSGRAVTAVRAGAPVAIRGRTSPLLAGQRIDLRASFAARTPYAAQKLTIPVRRVRVRPDGTFGFDGWRPPSAGRWTLGAVYTSHDPGFLDSVSGGCLPVVQVAPAAAG